MFGLISTTTYPAFKKWGEKFPDEVDLTQLRYHRSWSDMFDELFVDDRIKKSTSELTAVIKKDPDVKMYPPPELLFNAFLQTSFDKVSVVILGQDPYFNSDQAMGLSFSVPYGMDVPSSLQSVYNNLVKNKHVSKKPKHGNLEFWASQGCLMLNTSLTVVEGKENINGHQHVWKWFTDKIIRYISDKKDNVVFVLWGANALDKSQLIDQDKHEVIVSSHPSGQSADKPLRNYPPFNNYDHFGRINSVLKKWGKLPIVWEL